MKSRILFTALLSIFIFQKGMAQSTSDFFDSANTFYNTYIKDGLVDYKAIQTNPDDLNNLLQLAKELNISKDDEKVYQAFWINAYNLQVIQGIVAHYPVNSPLDINGFFDKTARAIGGKQITLNDIENKLLRGNFPNEARFHFVLVCAGLGCPPIINTAYTPGNLEMLLQKQTEAALNNPSFIRVKGKRVQLSQIFEWYKEDFIRDGKSEIDFVNQFRQSPLDTSAKVGYYTYDWTLNDIK
ncbi:MAG: DUF547 domain-containing protein [Allomuricauda sp.]|nr:MAG: DUF547 domain-containing protein [Allomuricauda sp.]